MPAVVRRVPSPMNCVAIATTMIQTVPYSPIGRTRYSSRVARPITTPGKACGRNAMTSTAGRNRDFVRTITHEIATDNTIAMTAEPMPSSIVFTTLEWNNGSWNTLRYADNVIRCRLAQSSAPRNGWVLTQIRISNGTTNDSSTYPYANTTASGFHRPSLSSIGARPLPVTVT